MSSGVPPSVVDPASVGPAKGRKPRGPARRRSLETLLQAETLRPADVFAVFGIPVTTVNAWCTRPAEDLRLPSIRIGSWRGRKGVRLIYRADLNAWLAWQRRLTECADRGESVPADEVTFALWQAKHPPTPAARNTATSAGRPRAA